VDDRLEDPAHATASVHLVLPSEEGSVAAARAAIVAAAKSWGFARRFDLALIASELVTNAVVHTTSSTIVVYCRSIAPSSVEVAVSDEGGGAPFVAAIDLGRVGGRGMRLVEAVAAAWGWHPLGTGEAKVVWARLDDGGHGSVTAQVRRDEHA
jgi:anti-sigma regulatory factor (Ser/Thr protein kinase)